MTYEEALSKTKSVNWKTEACNSGEDCWCRLIVPEVDIIEDCDEVVIISPSGCVSEELARYIVELQNNHIANKGKVNKMLYLLKSINENCEVGEYGKLIRDVVAEVEKK